MQNALVAAIAGMPGARMGDDDAAADDAGQKQGDENIAQDTHGPLLPKAI